MTGRDILVPRLRLDHGVTNGSVWMLPVRPLDNARLALSEVRSVAVRRMSTGKTLLAIVAGLIITGVAAHYIQPW